MKTTSAQRAANFLPRPDEPAWMMTGRPCGERGMLSGPRELNHWPAWLTSASDAELRGLQIETERRCPIYQLFARSGVNIQTNWTRAD